MNLAPCTDRQPVEPGLDMARALLHVQLKWCCSQQKMAPEVAKRAPVERQDRGWRQVVTSLGSGRRNGSQKRPVQHARRNSVSSSSARAESGAHAVPLTENGQRDGRDVSRNPK